MENSELIDNYFKGSPDPDQTRAFETRITTDPAFAKEVAFYLSVHSLAREVYQSEKKQLFRELYQQGLASETSTSKVSSPLTATKSRTTPVRKIIYYTAAAATVIGIIFGIYSYAPVSPQELAAKYEKKNLMTQGVTMGRSDSLQTGLSLYNDEKLDQALIQFEQMSQRDSTDSRATQYAGLAAFRLKDYDKALFYFKRLETFTKQFSNPGLFYEALTLMKRSQPGDADSAKQLLQQVVAKDLDGKETAVEWLGEWKK
jgi:tetratricopeptide (TPR) repeat protein